MARVLTVDLKREAVAYPYDVLQEVGVVNDSVGGTPLVVLWAPGTASALDAGTVALGRQESHKFGCDPSIFYLVG